MIPIMLSNIPPFSSMQIQHVEGGFLCVCPPSSPLAAKRSGDAAAALHLFLGSSEHLSEQSSAAVTEGLDQDMPVMFDHWPPHVCPQGSVFQATKIQRIGKSGASYMASYSAAGDGVQCVAFDRATLMEHLKTWMSMGALEESTQMLVSLSGMRPNPDMPLGGDTVFHANIFHSSRCGDAPVTTPYVLQSQEPKLDIGLIDTDVLEYVVDELRGDLEGKFAMRIEDSWLEFGPRIPTDE